MTTIRAGEAAIRRVEEMTISAGCDDLAMASRWLRLRQESSIETRKRG
jgi:hypothetical protein